MLASVYSYRVMVKSVSSCYVRGRRVLSDPVTYIIDMYNGFFTILIPNIDTYVLEEKHTYYDFTIILP